MRKYKHLHYGLKKNSTLSTILKTYFLVITMGQDRIRNLPKDDN